MLIKHVQEIIEAIKLLVKNIALFKWGEIVREILTKEASLFFIDDFQYAEFTNLFENSCAEVVFDNGLLSTEDVLQNCFNLWLMIQPSDKGIMESMEKTMYYTSDFLIFDAIRNNPKFHQLQKFTAGDRVLQCQVACCLANQLNLWLYEKLNAFTKSVLFNSSIGSYYTLDANLPLWENKHFLDEVSMFTKQVTVALADNRRFSDIFSKTLKHLEKITLYKQLKDKVL
ncbi:MAG: hypothetical protein KBT36_05905 [Kurthia sp.]|nr:hypothetical protein [Candidatus Kurthia equi]